VPGRVRDTSSVRLVPRLVLLGVIVLAPASCWLTASFDGLSDSGAGGDASTDAPPKDDRTSDARGDSPPPDDALDAPRETASDETTPDGPVTCLTAATYPDSVLAANPLAYWRLDEKKGPTAKDEEDASDGTYSEAGVTFGEMGALDGGSGTSVLLDGKSGQILVGGSFATKSQFVGKQAFSLEAWIWPTKIDSQYRGVVSNELEDAGGKQGYVVYLQNEAGIGFDRYEAGSSTPLRKLGEVPTGTWSHVVAVYNPEADGGGMSMTLYVDGKSVADHSTTLSIVTGCTFSIGATHCGTTGFFEGYVDEVAVYPVALDELCIRNHYHLGSGK
jgi:hypothetical protein